MGEPDIRALATYIMIRCKETPSRVAIRASGHGSSALAGALDTVPVGTSRLVDKAAMSFGEAQVNPNVPRQPCSADQHAVSRRQGSVFCVGCGVRLIVSRV